MIKYLFTIINVLIVGFCTNLYGQVLDSAKYKCTYRLRYIKDTLNKINISEDEQILLIGSHVNYYFSYTNYQTDSVFNAFIKKKQAELQMDNSRQMVPAINELPATMPFDNNYKLFVYYADDSILILDKVSLGKYKFSDVHFLSTWKLFSDTASILGYKCQKAVSNFRGRNYIAWFTKDVPIYSGPYKFYGLPGLILKVYDDQKNFDFECIGLEKLSKKIAIILEAKEYQLAERKKVEELKKLFYEHPFKFMLETTGKANSSSGKDLMQFERPLPYNPIERE